MVQSTNDANGLWVHQESTIIGADSHDIWSFTPEFLLSNDIVPRDWVCTLATRGTDDVTIRYGPLRWWMTESNLWITSYPDCRIEDESRYEGGHVIPLVAKKYLERVPFLPAQRMWFYWRLSVVDPMASEWMLNTFLTRSWPTKFENTSIEPNLTFVVEDTLYRMWIKIEESQRGNKTYENSIIFECFSSNVEDNGIENMISAADLLSTRLDALKEAIGHLLRTDGSL